MQVEAAGQIHDVAVHMDGVGMVEKDESSLPGGKRQEARHDGTDISYASDLDLHTSDFAGVAYVSQQFETALASYGTRETRVPHARSG